MLVAVFAGFVTFRVTGGDHAAAILVFLNLVR